MDKSNPIGKYDEEELLAGIQNASHEIFTHLYSCYFANLALTANKYVKDMQVAESIVQNIFLKMWENPFELNDSRSLKAYLYRSVINAAINFVNQQKNISRHHLKISEQVTDAYIDTLQEEQELKALIYKEIERLPEQCRKVFKMSRFEGLKYKEIAQQLNISEKTVENHMVNALKILRTNLLDASGKNKFKNSFWSTTLLLILSENIANHLD